MFSRDAAITCLPVVCLYLLYADGTGITIGRRADIVTEKKRFKNYLAAGQRQPDLQIWSAGHQSRHWPHPQGRDAAWR